MGVGDAVAAVTEIGRELRRRRLRRIGQTPDEIAEGAIAGDAWWQRAIRFVVLNAVGGAGLFVASLLLAATLTLAATGLARVLLLVDEYTPGGTVGLIGLTLLVSGFACQIVALWI